MENAKPTPALSKTSPSDAEAAELGIFRHQLTAWSVWREGMTLAEARAIYEVERQRRDAEHERAKGIKAAALLEASRRQQAAEVDRMRDALNRVGVDTAGMDDGAVGVRFREEREARARASAVQARRESLFRAAGCPERHVRNLDTLGAGHKEWTQARDAIVGRLRGDGFLLPLLGTRGTGKTQLAVSVIHKACGMGLSARYVKALDLFRIIRGSYTPVRRGDAGESESDVIDELARFDLLVIDELHQRAETPFEQNTLVNLLDRRYDAMRFTILIANQSRDEFGKAMGDSIKSRIHETGKPIECGWASFRKPGMWAEGGAA